MFRPSVLSRSQFFILSKNVFLYWIPRNPELYKKNQYYSFAERVYIRGTQYQKEMHISKK